MLQEREAAAKQQEMEEARREAMEKAKEYEEVRSEVRLLQSHFPCPLDSFKTSGRVSAVLYRRLQL